MLPKVVEFHLSKNNRFYNKAKEELDEQNKGLSFKFVGDYKLKDDKTPEKQSGDIILDGHDHDFRSTYEVVKAMHTDGLTNSNGFKYDNKNQRINQSINFDKNHGQTAHKRTENGVTATHESDDDSFNEQELEELSEQHSIFGSVGNEFKRVKTPDMTDKNTIEGESFGLETKNYSREISSNSEGTPISGRDGSTPRSENGENHLSKKHPHRMSIEDISLAKRESEVHTSRSSARRRLSDNTWITEENAVENKSYRAWVGRDITPRIKDDTSWVNDRGVSLSENENAYVSREITPREKDENTPREKDISWINHVNSQIWKNDNKGKETGSNVGNEKDYHHPSRENTPRENEKLFSQSEHTRFFSWTSIDDNDPQNYTPQAVTTPRSARKKRSLKEDFKGIITELKYQNEQPKDERLMSSQLNTDCAALSEDEVSVSDASMKVRLAIEEENRMREQTYIGRGPTGIPAKICCVCNKRVKPHEQFLQGNKVWHRHCTKCVDCARNLQDIDKKESKDGEELLCYGCFISRYGKENVTWM